MKTIHIGDRELALVMHTRVDDLTGEAVNSVMKVFVGDKQIGLISSIEVAGTHVKITLAGDLLSLTPEELDQVPDAIKESIWESERLLAKVPNVTVESPPFT